MISKFLIFKRAYQSNGKKRVALIVDLLRSTQHVVEQLSFLSANAGRVSVRISVPGAIYSFASYATLSLARCLPSVGSFYV